MGAWRDSTAPMQRTTGNPAMRNHDYFLISELVVVWLVLVGVLAAPVAVAGPVVAPSVGAMPICASTVALPVDPAAVVPIDDEPLLLVPMVSVVLQPARTKANMLPISAV